MQYKEGTLGYFLRTTVDSDFIMDTIYSLDSQMQQIHNRGYCLKNISFGTVVFDEYENVTFENFYKITDSRDIYNDINDFNNFSMGLFVLINSKELGYYSDVGYFDYSNLAKRDRLFISQNYDFIKQTIPQELVEYYDSSYSDTEVKYLTDFIKNKNSNEAGKDNARTLVKATAVGRALTERESNTAAFAEALVYPILAFCGMLLIILTYLLYTCL